MRKNWPSIAIFIAICSMVLYIIPPNFRLIAEIIKDLKQEYHSGWTDRQMHRQTDSQPDALTDDQYLPAPMVTKILFQENAADIALSNYHSVIWFRDYEDMDKIFAIFKNINKPDLITKVFYTLNDFSSISHHWLS